MYVVSMSSDILSIHVSHSHGFVLYDLSQLLDLTQEQTNAEDNEILGMFFQGDGMGLTKKNKGILGQIQSKMDNKIEQEYIASSHKNPSVIKVYNEYFSLLTLCSLDILEQCGGHLEQVHLRENPKSL